MIHDRITDVGQNIDTVVRRSSTVHIINGQNINEQERIYLLHLSSKYYD